MHPELLNWIMRQADVSHIAKTYGGRTVHIWLTSTGKGLCRNTVSPSGPAIAPRPDLIWCPECKVRAGNRRKRQGRSS